MTLKLSNTAVIFESAGDTVLVCDSFDYHELISLGDSDNSLPAGYVNDYFGYTVGTQAGFAIGGWTPGFRDEIDRFSFASEDDTVDTANLSEGRYGLSGSFSSTHGYGAGGTQWTGSPPPFNSIKSDRIDKFAFASENDAIDVGDLSAVKSAAGGGSSSTTHGYSSGGMGGPPAVPVFNYANRSDVIDKYPFAIQSGSSNVGNLTAGRYAVAGHQSSTHGYTSGGAQGGYNEGYSFTNIIDKFPFAVSPANATDVGDLIDVVQGAAGQSSFTEGYRSGGIQSEYPPGPTFKFVNEIDKFPFATDTNATDTGDLQEANKHTTGFSSNVSGYTAGGNLSPSSTNYTNRIQKFPFSNSFTTAADVADLALARGYLTGTQA